MVFLVLKRRLKRRERTATLVSIGLTQNPDGRRGISSASATSTGAKTNCAQAPTALWSIPLQS